MKPLKNLRRKRRHAGAVLTITALVDILTILLIFLLKSFSPEGALLYAAQDLELPETTSRKGITEGDLVLSLSAHGLSLGGEPITSGEEMARGGGLLLPRLMAALEEAAPDGRSECHILVEGDRGVRFHMLHRVLFTCRQSGYEKLALAAYEKESEGEGGTP